jgi:predicted HTH domain antitoxin
VTFEAKFTPCGSIVKVQACQTFVLCRKQAEGRISSGKAARLLNLSRVEFLALLRARGIAYINYTPDELAEEFAAVEALEVKTAK